MKELDLFARRKEISPSEGKKKRRTKRSASVGNTQSVISKEGEAIGSILKEFPEYATKPLPNLPTTNKLPRIKAMKSKSAIPYSNSALNLSSSAGTT